MSNTAGSANSGTYTVGEFKCLLEIDDRLPIASLDLAIQNAANVGVGDKLLAFAKLFIGLPYGSESLLPRPDLNSFRFRTKSLNCITFVYILLAMAKAKSFEDMLKTLYTIRYHAPDSRGLNSDPAEGNIYDLPTEALMIAACESGMLENVTENIFLPSVIKVGQIDLRSRYSVSRQSWVNGRFGIDMIPTPLIETKSEDLVDDADWKNGDIVILFKRDGDGRFQFTHAALIDADNSSFIHCTPHFIWPPLDQGEATGVFYTDTPKREMLGVSYGYVPSSPQMFAMLNQKAHFSYDTRYKRTIGNYFADNFDSLVVLRA